MAHHDWTPNPIKRSGYCLLFPFLRGQPREGKTTTTTEVRFVLFTEGGKKHTRVHSIVVSIIQGTHKRAASWSFRLQGYLFPSKHTLNLGARGPNLPLPEALFQSYEYWRCCDGNSSERLVRPILLSKKETSTKWWSTESETSAPDGAPKRVYWAGRQNLKEESRAHFLLSHCFWLWFANSFPHSPFCHVREPGGSSAPLKTQTTLPGMHLGSGSWLLG